MSERARQSVTEKERKEPEEAFPEHLGRSAVNGANASEAAQTGTDEARTDEVLDAIDEVLAEVPSPEDIQRLMSDIDATLETNPEQFLQDFRQENGQ